MCPGPFRRSGPAGFSDPASPRMTPPIFAIGQMVDFNGAAAPKMKTSGPYEVTRVLPADDAWSQRYRIKSPAEPFERTANGYEIVMADGADTPRTAAAPL